jgi:anti-anti-sigma regulatory factor
MVLVDLAVVDALARLALAERRRGRKLRLCAVPGELRELLALTGLDRVLLAVEPGRKPEEREEPAGVEEERELDDPAL